MLLLVSNFYLVKIQVKPASELGLLDTLAVEVTLGVAVSVFLGFFLLLIYFSVDFSQFLAEPSC